jgi:hypothetical protein
VQIVGTFCGGQFTLLLSKASFSESAAASSDIRGDASFGSAIEVLLAAAVKLKRMLEDYAATKLVAIPSWKR